MDSAHPYHLRSIVIARIPRREPRVLLVEDDRVLADMYRLSLLLDGFMVDVAPDGEAGIERVTRGRLPDAVVLDLNRSRVDRRLPRRDGIDMLTMLRAAPPTQSIPVVVLTTSTDDRDRFDAYQLNVAGYLLKPVTFAAFCELMTALNKYWTLVEM